MQTIAPARKPGKQMITVGSTRIGPYYWVGRCGNGVEYFTGQTFMAPASGDLCCIRLFPAIVFGETQATVAVYELDERNYTWHSKYVEVSQHVHKHMEGQWISFQLAGITVNKNKKYGFKVSCEGNGMLAIAEQPWLNDKPAPGEQWTASSLLQDGCFHKDFDLAYEAHIMH